MRIIFLFVYPHIFSANSANLYITTTTSFFLDTTHPEVREHIKDTLDTATNVWGFSYLKLDFLYSAVLGKELLMDGLMDGWMDG